MGLASGGSLYLGACGDSDDWGDNHRLIAGDDPGGEDEPSGVGGGSVGIKYYSAIYF